MRDEDLQDVCQIRYVAKNLIECRPKSQPTYVTQALAEIKAKANDIVERELNRRAEARHENRKGN